MSMANGNATGFIIGFRPSDPASDFLLGFEEWATEGFYHAGPFGENEVFMNRICGLRSA